MPQFDAQSAERISQTVQEWERRTRVQGQTPPGYMNQQWWRWMVLTEALAAGGEADANPVSWAAAGTYGGTANKGAYTVLTGTTYTVRDTTGKLSGSVGDWVLCRPIGNNLNVTVWEVVTVPYRRSYGGVSGYGTTACSAGSWTRVAFGSNATVKTSDLTIPATLLPGAIHVQQAGTYRLRGEVSAKSNSGDTERFKIRLYTSGGVQLGEEMWNFSVVTGSGVAIEGYAGVTTAAAIPAATAVYVEVDGDVDVTRMALTVGLA